MVSASCVCLSCLDGLVFVLSCMSCGVCGLFSESLQNSTRNLKVWTVFGSVVAVGFLFAAEQ